MNSLLVDYARENFWCNPDQDRQVILQPQRLSRSTGALNTIKVMLKIFDLPTQKEKYHVFQVGHRHPKVLGLFSTGLEEIKGQWVPVKDAMIKEKVMVDIYVDSGIQIPKYNVWYMYTPDNNFIFAVREDSNLAIDYKSEDIFFRIYSNSYFESDRSLGLNNVIYVNSMKVYTDAELLALQNDYDGYVSKSGFTTAFVNGVFVKAINFLTAKKGDSVEFVYDSSGMRKVDIKVQSMLVFDGELDKEERYLCHYPKQNEDDNEILYHDDIDIYVYYEKSDTLSYGLYFHRNKKSACRMVTHRDYSLSVGNIDNIYTALKRITGDENIDYSSLKVRLLIRNSGYDRSLVFESSKIHELYKLPDDKIVGAMLGVNSTVSVWEASKLEAAGYTTVMRSDWIDITSALVEKAMGYNAISKVLGDVPVSATYTGSNYMAAVPSGLVGNCTAYMYDYDGKFRGWEDCSKSAIFRTTRAPVKHVEFISGYGTHNPDNRFGVNNIDLPVGASYRVYMSHRGTTGSDNKWVDITNSDKYRVENNTLIWNGEDVSQYLMVRTDLKFLAYDFNHKAQNGLFKFALTEIQNRENVVDLHYLEVPYGELDIFIDEFSLIEGIDYIVNGHEVVVINKEYLDHEQEYQVHVRACGFCNSDLTRDKPDDIGFIQYGYLSNNNRHDLRDDRVMRIIVKGKYVTRDSIEFSEEHTGVSIVDSSNGSPYCLKDIVVPTRDNTLADTYDLLKIAKATDKEISEYLTDFLPEPDRDGANAIHELNDVYSPFLSAILDDLSMGFISPELYTKDLSLLEADAIVEDYKYLLAFDPTQPAFKEFQPYLVIHPTIYGKLYTLNLYQLRLMRKLVDLYGNGLVDLSSFIILEEI